MVDSLNVSHRL